MDTLTLQTYLGTIGTVCALDELPQVSLDKGFFIYNVAKKIGKDAGGIHWNSIAIYQRDGIKQINCFDSMGCGPFLKNVVDFININAPGNLVFNKYPVQDPDGSLCGLYSLAMLHFIERGGSFEEFLSNFSPTDFKQNDVKITRIAMRRNWLYKASDRGD